MTPDDADRMLDGADATSPLGQALARLSGLANGSTPAAAAIVPQMTAAATAGSASWIGYAWLFRPRGVVLAKLLMVATASTAVVGSTLAATGTLPAPVQDAVANVVDGVGIDIPGGDEPASSGANATREPPTTSSSTSSPSTSTATSLPTSTPTASTTTPAGAATTPPPPVTGSGPDCGGGSTSEVTLDEVDARFELTGPDATSGTLIVSAVTTGRVESVTAAVGGVDGGIPLAEAAPGNWTASRELPGGASRGGEMILLSAVGCGFAETTSNMTIVYAPGP